MRGTGRVGMHLTTVRFPFSSPLSLPPHPLRNLFSVVVVELLTCLEFMVWFQTAPVTLRSKHTAFLPPPSSSSSSNDPSSSLPGATTSRSTVRAGLDFPQRTFKRLQVAIERTEGETVRVGRSRCRFGGKEGVEGELEEALREVVDEEIFLEVRVFVLQTPPPLHAKCAHPDSPGPFLALWILCYFFSR